MKVTLNWLKRYVDFSWTPEELSERLTMLGIEVEGVVKVGGGFEGVVVAQVITRERHPNADKLSVCRVNDGKGERQIVCGAQNFKAGDKVPLILPGHQISKPGEEPFTIKVGRIRGVESHGMMCSSQELGLPGDGEGLMLLSEDAQVGQPLAEHFGRGGSDVVYDLEITPNRPDLNSVIGIAREISALTGNPLRLPELKLPENPTAQPVSNLVSVRIDDADLCPRYTARMVRGVKVGTSPDWLKNMLEKVGVRSISNVVDVTNFVMLEVGQPLHAFDYHLLGKDADGRPTIVVRRASEGEKFISLDGQERSLTPNNLLIADEHKAVALAGVMGGQNSEIQPRTVDVLIESACFKPQNIRATSKKLELRTESSYRYERGADVEICDWASQRAAQLILETAGGELAHGVVDAYARRQERKQITLRHAKVGELLGIELKPEQIETYLGQLGLNPVTRRPVAVDAPVGDVPPTTFRVPSFRVDLKREVDLIEEVARLHGVDKIPATPPRGAIGANEYDAVHDQLATARSLLSGMGLFEAQGQTLISDSAAKVVASAHSLCPLNNPLSSDMNVLRPSLLPGLLDALRHNLRRNNHEVALFEVGRVFLKSPDLNIPIEESRRVAVALTGNRHPLFWSGDARDAKFDIYDLKGCLEEFLEQFGVRGVTYARRPDMTPLFAESGTINLGRISLGEMGQVLPALAKLYDLRDPVFLAELGLDQLLARRNPGKSFKTIPAYPSIRRDLAMLLPEAVTHDAVLQTVRQSKTVNLESVELFDVFRGQSIPAGQKSVAYAFTYRNPERTLTDVEVGTAHEKLVGQLKERLQAVVRDN